MKITWLLIFLTSCQTTHSGDVLSKTTQNSFGALIEQMRLLSKPIIDQRGKSGISREALQRKPLSQSENNGLQLVPSYLIPAAFRTETGVQKEQLAKEMYENRTEGNFQRTDFSTSDLKGDYLVMTPKTASSGIILAFPGNASYPGEYFDQHLDLMRGTGKTVITVAWPQNPKSSKQLEAYFQKLIIHLKQQYPGQTIDLKGHSMGGAYATMTAAWMYRENQGTPRLLTDRSFIRIEDVISSWVPGTGFLSRTMLGTIGWNIDPSAVIDDIPEDRQFHFYAPDDEVILGNGQTQNYKRGSKFAVVRPEVRYSSIIKNPKPINIHNASLKRAMTTYDGELITLGQAMRRILR